MILLTVLAVAGGAVLAGIGFTGSYTTLVRLAHTHGFGWFADVFPIGVDAGIVVLLALDLYLILRQTPWPLLRLLAHTFTLATIWFNASAAGPITADPVGAGMHAVIPVCFIASVEAGRRLVIRVADIEAGKEAAGVPLHRWLLAPSKTWRMYRRMRLWTIPSYSAAVGLERDLTVYRVMLDRTYGSWRKAPSDALLPLTMAPYGLTVDEALALPGEAEQAEQARAERARRKAAQQATDAEIDALRERGRIDAARHEVEAATVRASAQARSARAQAEADAEAFASAEAAEALLHAAETRNRAAETNLRAAETEEAANTAQQRAAEAAEATTAAQERAALARDNTEAANLRAAEAEKAAAEARARAAETELRAVEAEDTANLSPQDRAVRKVARMILATGGTADHLDLQTIADALGVSVATASNRRRAAADLIATGYRP